MLVIVAKVQESFATQRLSTCDPSVYTFRIRSTTKSTFHFSCNHSPRFWMCVSSTHSYCGGDGSSIGGSSTHKQWRNSLCVFHNYDCYEAMRAMVRERKWVHILWQNFFNNKVHHPKSLLSRIISSVAIGSTTSWFLLEWLAGCRK